MKLKIILSVLLLFSLLKVDANPLVDISIASGKEEVFLHSNDIPFEILTTGKEDGSRSVIPLVPFVVFVEDSNYSVELDFMEGIGVVEIAISQNGSVIYSSSENILSPFGNNLQLPFGVSGEYCIEIKEIMGHMTYGCFEL